MGIASRGEWLPTVNGEAIINHPIFASSPIILHLHAPQISKLCIIKYKREDRIMHARDLSASKQSSACACYYRGVSISREQKFIFAATPHIYICCHIKHWIWYPAPQNFPANVRNKYFREISRETINYSSNECHWHHVHIFAKLIRSE